jgi:hypothetical protein
MQLSKPCKIWTGAGLRYGQIRVRRKLLYVHRKAWQDVNGPIPKGIYILHKCDNPRCYEITHLFSGTQSANQWDMVAKGRSAKGSRHSQHKLIEAEVLAIRADPRPAKVLAPIYGVHQVTIRDVRRRRTWNHI